MAVVLFVIPFLPVAFAGNSPGSCHITVAKDGTTQCTGRCSKSGYHCANGPTGCGCIPSSDPCASLVASIEVNATSPGSCYQQIAADGTSCCLGRCSKSGYSCANGPTGCGCVAHTMESTNQSPGSCHITVTKDGKTQCTGRCSKSGYHCANGPTGCGCIPHKVDTTNESPGSCHITVTKDGKTQCTGQCSKSGYHCANGPTGCGCVPSSDPCVSLVASIDVNATSPGSCYQQIAADGTSCCLGRCSKSGYSCANGPTGCGCIAATVV